jgi:hypothetical protein
MSSHALKIVCALAVVWVVTARLVAHDLPADVLVQTFVKPEDQRLRLVVRVPLAAMGDVDYPTRGPSGLVDLTRIDRALQDAATMWLVPGFQVYENGVPIGRPRVAAVRISLPSDRSFSSYTQALEHVSGPSLDPDIQLYWNQAMLDAVIEYDIRSDQSAFAIQPAVARLGVHVVTALRFLPPGGAVRAFEFAGDPGIIRLDPRWHHAAFSFVRRGFTHILDGTDHLLFLVCLVIPLRRFRALVPVVTAFAVAHSITLIASAFSVAPDALWFPPLIETLIALSIVYMALENMLARRFDHRWVVAFGFGLIHGFGFSFALRDSLQFAGSHLVTSLLSFNVGVEFGQLLVLLLLIPPLNLLFRYAVSERVATIVVSAVVAHSAWHWMIDRGRTLGQFTFQWPDLDAALGADLVGWMLLLAIAAGVLRVLRHYGRRAGLLATPDPDRRT